MSTYVSSALMTAILLVASAAYAQAPDSLSFQGRLTDASSNPINSGGLSMTFALYKGATKVWEETQSVVVTDGFFNVLLGKVTPLKSVPFDKAISLGIKVGADPEVTPRTPLAAAAYARALPGLYTYYLDDLAGNQSYNVMGGHPNNTINTGVTGATVGGGGGTASSLGNVRNSVWADFATVGGGAKNWADGEFSFIGGGAVNQAVGYASTIGGGGLNDTGENYDVVAGGSNNLASGPQASVGGGDHNRATGLLSTVAGGSYNSAVGQYSAVPGGAENRADGNYSFAAGYKAKAKYDGTFVWNDRSVTSGIDSLVSTGINQFIVRAVNGVGINKPPVGKGIHLKQQGNTHLYGIRTEYNLDGDYWDTYVDGAKDYNFGFNSTLKAWILDTDGSYHSSSDATLKEDVEKLGNVLPSFLELDPSTYRFKDAPVGDRSIGLIAQEVEAVFPDLVSEKDGLKGINHTELGIVSVRAIQELYALVQALQDRLDSQEVELTRLRQTAGR